MLDRHKVQRTASERMALSSRVEIDTGCMLCHQVHHTGASLLLDMLVLSHTMSAAQQQICKTAADQRERERGERERDFTDGAPCKVFLLLLHALTITALIRHVVTPVAHQYCT